MLYEFKTSRYFTSPKLGEIIGKRAFSADGAPNRVALAQAGSSTGMRIAMDGMFTQVTPQHTPTSAMQILDALEATRWAYILCAYSEENSALSLEDFFKSGAQGYRRLRPPGGQVPVVGEVMAPRSRDAQRSVVRRPSPP